jgi:hypothetical protein
MADINAPATSPADRRPQSGFSPEETSIDYPRRRPKSPKTLPAACNAVYPCGAAAAPTDIGDAPAMRQIRLAEQAISLSRRQVFRDNAR